jgi:hypothetical protein
MIPLGLSSADRRTLLATMFDHHRMRVLVQSTALDGSFDADLSDKLLDGQVDVDISGDVTRTASLTLLDPNGSLDFDSDSPADAALFLDRMIRIWVGIRVDYGHGNGDEWQDIPVFTGPITSLSRDGSTVDIECQGKEALCMGAVWRPMTLKKNTGKVAAIRTILKERAGETRFDLPSLRARLPNAISLGREAVPWTRARQIARSLGNHQLFYDGRGVCRLRRWPHRPALTFHADTLLSEPQVSYAQDSTINAIFIKGGVPKGKRRRLTAEVFPTYRHPLSPARLGRNGVPRFLMESVENPHIRTVAAATHLARTRLRHGLAQAIDASFDVLPCYLLEPGDLVRAVPPSGSPVTVTAHTFSLPLTAGAPMTVGYLRNVSPRRRHGTHRAAMATRTRARWIALPKPPAKKAPAKKATPAKTTTTHHTRAAHK